MRKYFLKRNDFIPEIKNHLNGLPINNVWIVLDRSEFDDKIDLKSNLDCIIEVQTCLFELNTYSWTLSSCDTTINFDTESESIEGLIKIYSSLLRKDIPDKAIVLVHDENYIASCPSIAIWDAENCTIYDSDGERNYPYFDDDVEEIFKDEKPLWYQKIYKHLK
jgi:hypothetical protein